MNPSVFNIGDTVFCNEPGHIMPSQRIWTIAGDDTNRTPVVDPEPAYKLVSGKNVRYAYQSLLVRAVGQANILVSHEREVNAEEEG